MGRRSGNPHTIEIWFAMGPQRIFMLAGGGHRADWVRNILADPEVEVRMGGERRRGFGRVVDDPEEEALARRLLAEKYQGWREGTQMSEWARTALPVAIDLVS